VLQKDGNTSIGVCSHIVLRVKRMDEKYGTATCCKSMVEDDFWMRICENNGTMKYGKLCNSTCSECNKGMAGGDHHHAELTSPDGFVLIPCQESASPLSSAVKHLLNVVLMNLA